MYVEVASLIHDTVTSAMCISERQDIAWAVKQDATRGLSIR